jgi:hypothetical protein
VIAAVATIHPWEKAGLGRAPFEWLGITEERGPKRVVANDGVEFLVGAPGQPMGTCSYCGMGIAECHHIRSADGKKFIVGCDCVSKVHAEGEPVLTAAERASRDLRNTKARKRAAAKGKAVKGELAALLADAAIKATLSGLPHPRGFVDRSTGQPLTLLDSVQWLAEHSGRTGKAKALKLIQKAVSP